MLEALIIHAQIIVEIIKAVFLNFMDKLHMRILGTVEEPFFILHSTTNILDSHNTKENYCKAGVLHIYKKKSPNHRLGVNSGAKYAIT